MRSFYAYTSIVLSPIKLMDTPTNEQREVLN